jgi:hypothetical protein
VAEDVERYEVEPELRLLPAGRPPRGARQATDGQRGPKQKMLEVSAIPEFEQTLAARMGPQMRLKAIGEILAQLQHPWVAVLRIL